MIETRRTREGSGGTIHPAGARGSPAPRDRLTLRRELSRKSIHVATIGLPLAAWLLPRPWALGLLALGAGAAIFIEVARWKNRSVRYAFLRGTRRMLRRHERKGVAGATYMAVAYLIAFVIFPLPIAVTAMLYNGLGDAVAAVVGKRWGRHRTRWGKSWEGAGAGFAANLTAGILVPGIAATAAVAGAAGAALLEFLPIRIDDNLSVTLGGGACLWIATLLLGAWV